MRNGKDDICGRSFHLKDLDESMMIRPCSECSPNESIYKGNMVKSNTGKDHQSAIMINLTTGNQGN